MGLKGDKIGIISENRYEWCVSYLSVINGTGVVVPLDKDLPENEIYSLLERSEASTVFCSENYVSILLSKQKQLKKLKNIICFDYEENGKGVLSYPRLLDKG